MVKYTTLQTEEDGGKGQFVIGSEKLNTIIKIKEGDVWSYKYENAANKKLNREIETLENTIEKYKDAKDSEHGFGGIEQRIKDYRQINKVLKKCIIIKYEDAIERQDK